MSIMTGRHNLLLVRVNYPLRWSAVCLRCSQQGWSAFVLFGTTLHDSILMRKRNTIGSYPK